jgi:threonine/homoserine/homoserine lactone efflux protein
MNDTAGIYSTGIVLGLSAGLSPGPLMTLVVAEALRRGIPAGIRIAMAPLITDAPIIVLCLTLLATLAQAMVFIGGVALLGGFFIAWMGIDHLTFKGTTETVAAPPAPSLRKGIVANFLNPHPYLFWMTVGGPLIIKTHTMGRPTTALFLFFFYGCLVGAKILVAAVVGRYRSALTSPVYVWTIRTLGVLLLVFAVLFIQEGLSRLGWL